MLEKINIFFWKNYETSHKEHLHDAHLITPNSLKIIRFILMIIHSIVPLYYLFTWRVSSYKYLTVLGMNFTFIYFVLVNITNYFHEKGRNCSEFFKKITIVVFEVVFSLQLLITFFFWVFLYPVYDTKKLFPTWTAFLIVGLYMHSGCWICLCLDKIFNTIYFDRRHFVFLVLTIIFYALFSLIYEIIYEVPIYPIIKWGDTISYLYMIIALIMAIAPFYFGIRFSEYKAKNFSLNKKKPEIINTPLNKNTQEIENKSLNKMKKKKKQSANIRKKEMKKEEKINKK